MLKLMICEIRCGQSTPNMSATCFIGLTLPACASIKEEFISRKIGDQGRGIRWTPRPGSSVPVLLKEQGVEHDRFGEGDGQDGLDQDLRRGTGIASHRFRGFHADEP